MKKGTGNVPSGVWALGAPPTEDCGAPLSVNEKSDKDRGALDSPENSFNGNGGLPSPNQTAFSLFAITFGAQHPTAMSA